MFKFNVGRIVGKKDNRKFDMVFSITLAGETWEHAMGRLNKMIAESGMIAYPVKMEE